MFHGARPIIYVGLIDRLGVNRDSIKPKLFVDAGMDAILRGMCW